MNGGCLSELPNAEIQHVIIVVTALFEVTNQPVQLR